MLNARERHVGQWRTAFVVMLSLAILVGCDREPQVYHTQFEAMGTVIDVSLWDVDHAEADAAMEEIRKIMVDVERRWHAWRPSELTDINARLARGESATLDAASLASLRQAAELSLATDNLFNPGIGKLIKLWGFASDDTPHGPPPPDEAIAELLNANVTMADLQFTSDGVKSRNPALQIDLGGWAKTLGLNGAVAHLQSRGIKNAVVNAGGDLRMIGSKGDKPWRVGIRNPRGPGVIAAVEGRGDESVFTSGDYERYFDWEGERYHHIIDPRTARPAQGIASATVIHTDTALVEAASKAVLIAGPDGWRDIAKRMGISQVMVITEDMKVYLTPAMAERLSYLEEKLHKEIVQ